MICSIFSFMEGKTSSLGELQAFGECKQLQQMGPVHPGRIRKSFCVSPGGARRAPVGAAGWVGLLLKAGSSRQASARGRGRPAGRALLASDRNKATLTKGEQTISSARSHFFEGIL